MKEPVATDLEVRRLSGGRCEISAEVCRSSDLKLIPVKSDLK